MKVGIAERVDSWVGKTLFIPIIIRLCQCLGCTPHRFNRVCWFIAALIAFGFARGLGGKVVLGLFAIVLCVSASLVSANFPATSWRWFRLTVLALLIWDVFGEPLHQPLYDTLILFAEYAALIRTIPPLESKKRKQKRAPARATS